jgi:hypothetical protein
MPAPARVEPPLTPVRQEWCRALTSPDQTAGPRPRQGAASGSKWHGAFRKKGSGHVGGYLGYGSVKSLTGEQVGYLITNKLLPLGVVAAEGAPAAAPKANPLFALRARNTLLPARAANAAGVLLRPLFRWPVVLAVLAGVAAVDYWLFAVHGLGGGIGQILRNPADLLIVLGLSVVSALFHECGHAVGCRYGGARSGVIGVGMYLVWPSFFTNVTDSYRLSRAGRLNRTLRLTPQGEPERGGRVFGRPAGPQPTVAADCAQRPGLDPVQVQPAAKVVDFVLDDTRRPPREHPVDRLAVPVQRLDPDGPVAGHHPGESGDAQAPFVEADLIAVAGQPERGVDQDGEGQPVPLPGGSFVLGQLTPALRAVLQHRELDGHPDLGRRQPDARRGLHRGPHLGDQQLELAGAQLGGVDRLGRAAQGRVAAFDDGQYVRTAHGPLA